MTFAISELHKTPALYHAFLTVGKIEHGRLVVADSIAKDLLAGNPNPPVVHADVFTPPPSKRPDDEILRIESICNACAWNIDWTCEHPGCAFCRSQRRTGASLKNILRNPTSRCPAGHWHSLKSQ